MTRLVLVSFTATLLLAIVALGHRARAASDDEDMPVVKRKPRTSLSLPGKRVSEANGVTRCGACHMVDGWEKVRFNHDPTGFPLRGAHVNVTCNGCHSQGFDKPVADTCSGCHRDRHASEFGLHCEGCHDERSWRPLFNADAHRSTNFPLVGRHALIPCTECHGNVRDRVFAQAAVRCDACHEKDFLGTSASALTTIDHTANNFSRDCQTCHNTFRFFPASMRQHDHCFGISSGSHHGIRCMGCHTSLATVTFTGACGTGTYNCSGCHDHLCARMDVVHKTIMGYACANPRCLECHSLRQ